MGKTVKWLVIATWHLHQFGQWFEGQTFRAYDAAQRLTIRHTGGYSWLPASRKWWDGK